jgi:hypothetical protein
LANENLFDVVFFVIAKTGSWATFGRLVIHFTSNFCSGNCLSSKVIEVLALQSVFTPGKHRMLKGPRRTSALFGSVLNNAD